MLGAASLASKASLTYPSSFTESVSEGGKAVPAPVPVAVSEAWVSTRLALYRPLKSRKCQLEEAHQVLYIHGQQLQRLVHRLHSKGGI